MARRIEQFQSVIDNWKRKDIDAVLASMSEGIVWHFAAAAEPPLVGKTAARKFLVRFGADIAEIRWRIIHHAETENRLFVEGVDEYVTPAGVTISAPYAGVIEFDGDFISAWRDYVDVGVMRAQRNGEPITSQVRQLAQRPSI